MSHLPRAAQGALISWGAIALLVGCGSPAGDGDSGTQNGNDSGQQSGNDSGTGGPDGGGNNPDSGIHPDGGNADSGSGNPDSGNRDGGNTSLCGLGFSDGGGAFTTAGPNGYPAAHLAPPQMVYGCDRLLYAPKLVTATFQNETKATTFETFDDTLTTTQWWTDVSQYCGTAGCIGQGTSGGHVHFPFSPPTGGYTDTPLLDGGAPSTIKDLIREQVDSGTLPIPDNNTLYAIYFPAGTKITLTQGGQTAVSCQAFGGYHSSVGIETPNGPIQAAYAIVPQCPFLSLFGLPTTVAASHEIIEATTDPLVNDVTANGYYMDQSRDAWQAITAAEVGDVCALLQDFQAVAVKPVPNPPANEYQEGTYVVQRSFSNASLLAGHDPCVPVPSTPYFNVAPSVEKLVMTTKGQSQTIELTGFSEAAVPDWNVQVVDWGYLTTLKTTLTFTLDKSTANNGTTLHLTVTVAGTVDPKAGAPFVIISTPTTGNGTGVGFWPGIVETQ